MYPALHDSVGRLLEEDDLSFTFFAIDEDKGSIEEYDSNTMERFKCLNIVSSNAGYASKKIAITIRVYRTTIQYPNVSPTLQNLWKSQSAIPR
jgi:hypothetical protein